MEQFTIHGRLYISVIFQTNSVQR